MAADSASRSILPRWKACQSLNAKRLQHPVALVEKPLAYRPRRATPVDRRLKVGAQVTMAELALLNIETHSRDPSVAHQNAARCLRKQLLQRRVPAIGCKHKGNRSPLPEACLQKT